MEVILLEKMRNLGALGDKVRVKSGFARNYLVPQGKAVYATKDNVAKFEQRRTELEKSAVEKHKKALARQESIAAVGPVTVSAKAGDEGKLFGSIGTRDIVDALRKAGIEVEKREVRLAIGTIRNTGEYEVMIDLESDVAAAVKLNVVGEG